VGLSIIGKNGIRSLNKKWRKKDKTTDVLSFPLHEFRFQSGKIKSPDIVLPGGLLSLGDIVISKDSAEMVASENNMNVASEYIRLFVHGLLHLLGYDHERGLQESEIQFQLEKKICKKLGIEFIG